MRRLDGADLYARWEDSLARTSPYKEVRMDYIQGLQRARFWTKVVKGGPGDCWAWSGEHTPKGYGRFVFGGRARRREYAHRVSWTLARGPIPDGMVIDHVCRNRGCCNPDHMEVVTSRENTLRGDGVTAAHAQKTHCRNGHPLSGDNVSVVKNGKKQAMARKCLACRRVSTAMDRLR